MKLKVRNFQSLRDVEINVDGYTVVTGPSNLGKSALVRALLALLENATGNSFITVGEKETSVQIWLNQHTVEYRKGAGTTYVVDGIEYRDAGRNRPVAVDLLGLLPLTVGGSDYWPQIQTQHEGVPYLVGERSPGVVQELLVANRQHEVYRLATKEAEQDASKESQEVRILEEVVEVTKKHLGTLEPLAGLLVLCRDESERYEKQLKTLQHRLTRLRTLEKCFQTTSVFLGNVKDAKEPTIDLEVTERRRRLLPYLGVCIKNINPVPLLRATLERLVGVQTRQRNIDSVVRVVKDRVEEWGQRDHYLIKKITGSGSCPLCGRESISIGSSSVSAYPGNKDFTEKKDQC